MAGETSAAWAEPQTILFIAFLILIFVIGYYMKTKYDEKKEGSSNKVSSLSNSGKIIDLVNNFESHIETTEKCGEGNILVGFINGQTINYNLTNLKLVNKYENLRGQSPVYIHGLKNNESTEQMLNLIQKLKANISSEKALGHERQRRVTADIKEIAKKSGKGDDK